MVFELVLYAFAAAVVVWHAFPRAKRLRSLGESFARRNQAYVDSEFVAVFDRAVVHGNRFAAVLMLVGMVAIRIVDARRVDHLPLQLHLVPLLGVFLAGWAGFRLWMAGREFPVPAGRAAVARPRRVTLTDYVPRATQFVTWVAAAVSVVLAVAALFLWRRGQLDPAPAAWTAVGAATILGMAVLVHVFGRAMCNRPQTAVDACHLYFQDAWRGESLIAAHAVVGYSAFYLFGGLYASAEGPDWFSRVLAPMSVVLAASVAWRTLGRPLQFRRRLWETLQPGQILLPGQPVPPRAGVSA